MISCKFFKELDNILGHRPASVPAVLLDTGTSSSTITEPEESTEEREANGNNKIMIYP